MQKRNYKRPKPPKDHDENPEWTAKDFARARPAREVVPQIVAAYEKRVGRPPHGERAKVPLSLRIDASVLEAYKSTGEGWQRRMGEVLAKAARKLQRGAE